MSYADDLAKLGATVRPCKFCARKVVFAKDTQGTDVCLDPTPPVYSMHGDMVGCSRLRGALVSHHATCTKYHEHLAAERLKRGTA